MDKPTAQRAQAILALMVGAFTFGCYLTFHEATIAADKRLFDQRIGGYKKHQKDQDDKIASLIERVIRLEIIVK